MHRYELGSCSLKLRLTPQGTWMVRGQTLDERFTDGKGVPRSREVLQPLLGLDNQPLLPASSLKGALRSTAERVLRSMHPGRSQDLVPLADDPFVHSRTSEGDLSEDLYRAWLKGHSRADIADSELIEWNEQRKQYAPDELAPACIYTLLSAASQLFGATVHAGLLTLTDAQPKGAHLQRRSHVAIDRLTGGVGEGPFIDELAPANAPLESELCITNFALWHLALLALTVQEFNAGYSAIGGGTRKGQGRVHITMSRLECRYAQAAGPITGGVVSAQARLAALASTTDLPPAVQAHEAGRALLPDLAPASARSWRDDGLVRVVVPDERLDELFRAAVGEVWVPWVEALVNEEASDAA